MIQNTDDEANSASSEFSFRNKVSPDLIPEISGFTLAKLLFITLLAISSGVLFYSMRPTVPIIVFAVGFAVFFPLTEKARKEIFHNNQVNYYNYVVELIVFFIIFMVGMFVAGNVYDFFGIQSEQSVAEFVAFMRSLSVFQINTEPLHDMIGDNGPGHNVNSYLIYSYFCFFVPFLYIILSSSQISCRCMDERGMDCRHHVGA